ncbi:MAG: hypothetical protein ACXWJN_02845 [Methyloceanibacter sp.]
MTGPRSAFVPMAMLAAQSCFGDGALAQAGEPPARPFVVADEQSAPTSDASLRKRAEDLARAASERFSEIMAGGRKAQEQVAQSTAPTPGGAPRQTGSSDDAFAPVWGWLARSAKDYNDVIVAKLKNPSGDVVILAPQGTVVAQKDALPQVPQPKSSELPEAKAPEPQAGWSWGAVEERVRDWLARANRSYRNEIVKKLKQPGSEEPQWPPAEVVPQAPTPADVAAEAEAEQHAAEVRREAEEAEAQRKADDAKRVAAEEEAKRKADAEAKRVADEAAAKSKADAEARRLADEAEAKRKADAEAKHIAEETEAKRKAEEKRLADLAEAKRKADAEAKQKEDAEAKRVADEAEAKRKAVAEAKQKADAEAKRLADEAEAKRQAEAEAKLNAAAETARRLKEESDTERKAVAESEATRLATEAEARRAAAAGVKPAHENSSVAVARPRSPVKPPAVADQDRKARKEVFVAEPAPPKIVKRKRRVVAYEARPKKQKRGQLAAQKHGRKHTYITVETRAPKRIVHAYRQKPHAAPPVPVRNKSCACPHAYRALDPKPHHVHRHAVRRTYASPRHVWRSCRG